VAYRQKTAADRELNEALRRLRATAVGLDRLDGTTEPGDCLRREAAALIKGLVKARLRGTGT